MITYRDPARSVKFNQFSKKDGLRFVYVDPYTGKILKDDATIYFFFITAHLHNSLMLGKAGQWIVDISTIIFLIGLVTGLILWWPKKWTKTTRRQSFTIRWKAKFKRVNYDLHNVLGFYTLSIVLVLTVTGLIIAFQPLADATIRMFGGDATHSWEKDLPKYQARQPTASFEPVLEPVLCGISGSSGHPTGDVSVRFFRLLHAGGGFSGRLEKLYWNCTFYQSLHRRRN